MFDEWPQALKVFQQFGANTLCFPMATGETVNQSRLNLATNPTRVTLEGSARDQFAFGASLNGIAI